jgi:hypothetical protein
MLDDTILEDHELGYNFAPPADPALPGHPRLEIVIHATPTERHFDPERVCVPIRTITDRSDELHVTHPWPQAEDYPVILGRISLHDRKGKQVEAFTLGGQLHIEPQDQSTLCSVSSTGPIFSLLVPDTLSAILAEEIEILIAERRAAWAGAPAAFEKRLLQCESQQLYLACLRALADRLADYPFIEDDPLNQLIHFLRSEACLGPDGLISPLKLIPALDHLL